MGLDSMANGRFHLLDTLPPGRFSLSYLAEDRHLGRRVVVRCLDRAAVPEHLQAQFRREARALAALRHPGVPAVHDFMEDSERLYVILETVQGRPLQEVMDQGAMAPDQALGIARQVAEALAAAHKRGLVHRDVQPRNIFLAGRGRARLVNFEISRTPESPAATQVLSSITVHEYLAPEQLFRGQADARSDLYSLGMVLYRMLAGPSTRVVIGGTRGRPVQLPPAPHWTPTLRRAVEPLLTQALAPDPDQRFQSAVAVVRALRACRASVARLSQGDRTESERGAV